MWFIAKDWGGKDEEGSAIVARGNRSCGAEFDLVGGRTSIGRAKRLDDVGASWHSVLAAVILGDVFDARCAQSNARGRSAAPRGERTPKLVERAVEEGSWDLLEEVGERAGKLVVVDQTD